MKKVATIIVYLSDLEIQRLRNIGETVSGVTGMTYDYSGILYVFYEGDREEEEIITEVLNACKN